MLSKRISLSKCRISRCEANLYLVISKVKKVPGADTYPQLCATSSFKSVEEPGSSGVL